MAITTSSSGVLDLLGPNGAAKSSSSGATSATGKTDTSATDRFLKLLVTQMQNQDPLNPMDNAQVTSQMAQISTVSGISDLNTTVAGLNGQFAQLQSLQAASLVGHDVTLAGNKLALSTSTTSATGYTGIGAYQLDGVADSVKLTVTDAAGTVVSSTDLGAQPAGLGAFEVPGVSNNTAYSFKLTASSAGVAVGVTPLMRDYVSAVSIVKGQLTLQTANSGAVAYSDVKAVN